MRPRFVCLFLLLLVLSTISFSQPIIYTVEYGAKPASAPDLIPAFTDYKGFENVNLVTDNWYYASRERADSINADAFIIPGGSTSDVPFYDGSLNSYIDLLRNPGRPTIGFCAGIQFLLMAQGGICANRSGEHGDQTEAIFEYDEIFENCPNPYTDLAAHNYSIVDIPDVFRNMATTRTCNITFARHITMPLYGSQLHIERMSNANSGGPSILSNFRNKIMARKFHGVAEALAFPGEPGKVLVTWWKAKTDQDVMYQIFHSTQSEIDFNNPVYETQELEYEFNGLDTDVTHYFAARALCSAFDDSNTAVFPIKADGHREIVFQNGLEIEGAPYSETEATAIYEKYPDSNFGKKGTGSSGNLYWWNSGLIKFKGLEKYLAGKKIIGGKLTFIFVGGVTDNTNSSHVADISIYRILKNWNEGTGTNYNPASDNEVTWNSAQHNILPWEVPGCKGATDIASDPIASFTIKGDGTGIKFDGTVELPPELIQTWVDYADSNCGLLYEKVDTYPHNMYFYFEDNEDDWFMNHPRLTVYYLDEEQSVVENKTPTSVPKIMKLLQNYPNPFNSSTAIPIEINGAQQTRLFIYNIKGQRVRKIFDGILQTGLHKISWDGRDEMGNAVPSGIYLYSLTNRKERLINRMVLVR